MKCHELMNALKEDLKVSNLTLANEHYQKVLAALPPYIMHMNTDRNCLNKIFIDSLVDACKPERIAVVVWILSVFGNDLKSSLIDSNITDEQLAQLISSELVRDNMKQDLCSLGFLLANAIKRGHIFRAAILLQAYPELRYESTDELGNPLLTLAIETKDDDMLDLLLKCGVDVNGLGEEGGRAALRYMLCGSADIGLFYPSDISQSECTHVRSIDRPFAFMPINQAIRDRNLITINKLIDAGVDINKSNSLSLAAYLGFKEIVLLLLEKGAELERKDYSGHTALIYAMRFNRTEIIHLLLVHGANDEVVSLCGQTSAELAAAFHNETALAVFDDVKRQRKEAFNHLFGAYEVIPLRKLDSDVLRHVASYLSILDAQKLSGNAAMYFNITLPAMLRIHNSIYPPYRSSEANQALSVVGKRKNDNDELNLLPCKPDGLPLAIVTNSKKSLKKFGGSAGMLSGFMNLDNCTYTTVSRDCNGFFDADRRREQESRRIEVERAFAKIESAPVQTSSVP